MAQFTPASIARNPRYASLLGMLLLFTTVLLLLPRYPGTSSGLTTDVAMPSTKIRTVSLEEFVQREEFNYQRRILPRRAALIQKWGPTPDKVDPFPPGNILVLWDYYVAGFNCPHRIQRLGNWGDGGKWMCGIERIAQQHAPCVTYSIGVNWDSSFEADLFELTPNCEVWGYDFSVSDFGPQISNNPEYKARANFFPYKLSSVDNHESNPPEYTLRSLMHKNGHDFIDIFKIDIEGAEFTVLEEFIRPYTVPGGPTLPVGQMQIEIHAWKGEGKFERFNEWWEMLEKAGFRPFWTEANLPYVSAFRSLPDLAEYSFINIKGRHALITPDY